MKWTTKRLAIIGAKKRYPYTLWMRSNSKDNPAWYIVYDEEMEKGFLNQLSNALQFNYTEDEYSHAKPRPW